MRESDSPPSQEAASTDENNFNDDEGNNNGGGGTLHLTSSSVLRSLLIASFLLSLLTLIDIYYTTFLLNTNNSNNNNTNNNNKSSWAPLKQIAEIFIPQILLRYSPSKYNGNHVLMNEMDVAIDGKICPPDGFLDDGLSQLHHDQSKNEEKRSNGGIHFSSEYDPRNKVLRPSLFPHCELKKWVEQHNNQQHQQKEQQEEQEKLHECSDGEEYITHIYPTNLQQQHHHHQQQQSSSSSNTNVKILHIAANNNCLPKGTIQSLQSLTNHYYTTSTTTATNAKNEQSTTNKSEQSTTKKQSEQSKTIIAIYIHTPNSIDTILHQHIWSVFPEVAEGLLCGIGKVQFVTTKVLDALLVKPATGFVAGAVATTDDTTDDQQKEKKRKRKKRKKEVISNEISYLIKRDIWRYLILWEFGGTVIDIDVLNSIIESGSSNLIEAAQDWFFGGGDNDGDAFVTLMDGTVLDGTVMQQNRYAVTSVMGASRPHHPLLYFAAKWALRTLTDDNYLVWGEAHEFRAFNPMGRNTDMAALHAGLDYNLGRNWLQVKSNQYNNQFKSSIDNTRSIRFVNGDGVLPKSLASPMHDMIPILKRHVDKSELPENDMIIIKSFRDMDMHLEAKHKEDSNYVSKPDGSIVFSCLEYGLQAYTNNGQDT